MKSIIYNLFLISVGLNLFFNCSEKSVNPEMVDAPPQFVVLNVSLQEDSLGNISGYLEGELTADTIPTIEYIKINDSTYQCQPVVNLGYVTFSLKIGEGSISDIDVEVKTSIGSVQGSISAPDNITEVALVPDTDLVVNQSAKIQWKKSKADYYRYIIDTPGRNDNYGILTTNEISMNQFIRTEGAYQFFISAINGPLAEENATANMHGEGFGFLYFESQMEIMTFNVKGSV